MNLFQVSIGFIGNISSGNPWIFPWRSWGFPVTFPWNQSKVGPYSFPSMNLFTFSRHFFRSELLVGTSFDPGVAASHPNFRRDPTSNAPKMGRSPLATSGFPQLQSTVQLFGLWSRWSNLVPSLDTTDMDQSVRRYNPKNPAQRRGAHGFLEGGTIRFAQEWWATNHLVTLLATGFTFFFGPVSVGELLKHEFFFDHTMPTRL